jgi:hypothetical protein
MANLKAGSSAFSVLSLALYGSMVNLFFLT